MKKIIKNTLLALGMSLAAAALISRWPEIAPRLAGSHWALLALAALGLIGYQFLNAGVWSLVLGALGHRVPFAKTAKVWLQSEALRWLPGGIWGYGSRVVNAQQLGVNKTAASSSLVLELALTNLAWAATAATLLFTPLAGITLEALTEITPPDFPWIPTLLGSTVAVLGATLLLATLPMVRSLVRKIAQLLPWGQLSPRLLLRTTSAYMGLCVFNGVLFWLVIAAVPNLSVSPLVAIGIGGAAWLAGFWAIGVPGGIGVREAAIAALLAAFGDLDSAIAVAVLWRALQMVVELLTLLLVSLPLLSSQRTPKSTPSPKGRKAPSFGHLRILNFL